MAQDRREHIRRLLDEADLTVSWLARRVGINKATLHTYISGTSEPTDSTIWSRLEHAIPSDLVSNAAIHRAGQDIVLKHNGHVPASEWPVGDNIAEAVVQNLVLAKVGRFSTSIIGYSYSPLLMPQDIAIWETDAAPTSDILTLSKDKNAGSVTVMVSCYCNRSQQWELQPISASQGVSDDNEWVPLAKLVAVVRIVEGLKVHISSDNGVTASSLQALNGIRNTAVE